MERKQIGNIILEKRLAHGAFGEVYLSTIIGQKGYFATKRIDRLTIDQPNTSKYFQTELSLLKTLNHPNIVKFVDFKATKDNYYIVMEYINGKDLRNVLKAYMKKYGKPFSEEIVQFLMKQIIEALKYLHGLHIMHRDLKLDNILVNFKNENDKVILNMYGAEVKIIDAIRYIHNLNIIHRDIKSENIMINFDNEFDKNNLNLMRAKVKLIDFGIACYKKKGLAYTVLGNPNGMSPTILNAYHNNKHYTQGYNEKADIWGLGSLCYELLLGHTAFNTESFDELVKKVENGTYNIPTNLSMEVVSFLNGMLQYDPEKRYSANQLANHPFLTKRVQYFHRMDLRKVSKNVVNGNLKINVKKNQTIWAIFNKEDEQKLISIGDLNNNLNRTNTSLMPINESMALQNSNLQNYIPPGGKNLYGISMFPENNSNNQISMSAKANDYSNKMNNQPAINYPTFSLPTIDMNNYQVLNKSNTIPPPNNNPDNNQLFQDINNSDYIPANNKIIEENEKDSGCNIY